ncbi:MAG TPA: hypothetical protein VG496_12540 [Myxococcales bacterium]|nr:hypothetical protein [Myxococcales bacterium]
MSNLTRNGQDPGEASAPLGERQSGLPRRGQVEQASSMRCAMASRQAPQSVPAPQQAATASTLFAPARTAASISRSLIARQMQRTIGPT